ncbi:MAG: hypothetical protein U0871_17170 [Gemmataceae bacterium]
MPTITGVVRNGAVEWKPGPPPEGTVFAVELPTPAAEPAAGEPKAGRGLSWVKEFAGAAEGLPPDVAEQHDHYLHGTAKR